MNEQSLVPVDITHGKQISVDPFLSYYHLISQTPFAVALLRGRDMVIEVANEKAFELWGKRSEEVMNKKLEEAFPELIAQGFKEILLSVYNTGNRFVANEQPVALIRNGVMETLYVNFSYDPLRDENGVIIGVLGVGNDVTELVVARKKERETETTLRNLIEQTPTPLLILRGENLVLEIANESLHELWGTSKQDIGKPFLEILPEMKGQAFYELLLKVLHTGKPYHGYETSVAFLRGSSEKETRYFDFVYQPYHEKDGRITGIIVLATDVTEQVIAKKGLEESERNFRRMVLQAPVAMCVLKGADHVVEVANERMFELWGKREDDLLHKPIFEGLPEIKGQGLEPLLDKVYSLGERFKASEHPIELPRNGKVETIYINFVYEPLREADGSVSGVMTVAVDVTDQVEARHKIEEAEVRARLAIESADMGTFEVDLRSDTIISSPRLDVIFGVKAGSPRMDYANAILPEDQPQREVAYRLAAETGVLQYEGRVKWQDGSIHWVRVNGRVYKDEEGNMIKLSGVAQDVTEQKNFQEALQAKHEELELVTQVMPQMVWAKNADGYTYFLNRRWTRYTGMKMEELLGWGWMKALHPEDYDRVVALWQEAIQVGEPYATEYRLRCRRGEYKWFLSKGIPVKDKEGKVLKWYGATTDIDLQKTQSVKLETLVEQRTEELRRSNEELEQFAHVASHDMKEPIRKAKVFAERLKNEFGHVLPEKGQSYLQRVQKATDRLTSMVEGVLNYSTINSSKQKIELINLNEVLKSIEADLELLIQTKSATIHYQELPRFEGAAFLIYQLFYNLLNNSLKFISAEKAPVVQIEAQLVSGKELHQFAGANEKQMYVEIKVEDNGIGFSAEHASRIFNTFTRLHSRDEYEGTGMGLATVKRIVDRHQGFIAASAEPGCGACFTIWLPQKQEIAG